MGLDFRGSSDCRSLNGGGGGNSARKTSEILFWGARNMGRLRLGCWVVVFCCKRLLPTFAGCWLTSALTSYDALELAYNPSPSPSPTVHPRSTGRVTCLPWVVVVVAHASFGNQGNNCETASRTSASGSSNAGSGACTAQY